VLLGLLAATAWGEQLHPKFPLLDANGRSVLQSGAALSLARSCAPCHDTAYIATHSVHAGAVVAPDPTGLFPAPDLGETETNCLHCHLAQPHDVARLSELARPEWMATATLGHTRFVARVDGKWTWNAAAFEQDGSVRLPLGKPTPAHCGQCHAPVWNDTAPVHAAALLGSLYAAMRAQPFSGQRLSASALNLAGKQALDRAFDVHAERLVACVNCHHAGNNPAYRAPDDEIAHLAFEARRIDVGEYLQQPDHNLARGSDGSMRGCVDCHEVAAAHDWLPHLDRHLETMRCEVCHIPRVYTPALMTVDATILTVEGAPRLAWRGVDGPPQEAANLIRGFEPALLVRRDADGVERLAPYQLVAVWNWMAGERPLPLEELRRALHEGGLPAVFDEDGDGVIAPGELHLGTTERVAAVRARLAAAGYHDVSIRGRIVRQGLHHTVASGRHAVRDCNECHARDSRISRVLPMDLSGRAPAGGVFEEEPPPPDAAYYLLGHDRVAWIDWTGILFTIAVVVGAAVHGVLRAVAHQRSQS
jgi:hypothetical protein